MKNLNNSLFKNCEPHKINNLAKIVGGLTLETKKSNGDCDFWTDEESKERCYTTDKGVIDSNGKIYWGDIYDKACK